MKQLLVSLPSIRRNTLFVLAFLLPINLGKHFVFDWSYVNGLLIDYLIPTIYVQDILVLLFLLFWGIELVFSRFSKAHLLMDNLGWIGSMLLLFLLSVGLSVIPSVSVSISIVSFVRLFVYIALAFGIANTLSFEKDFSTLVRIFSISTFLLGILAIFQWHAQGSIFDNYLFFGEQPYDFSTYNITKESLFGVTVVPPYGLFRHPNIFGGYLSVVLLWLFTSLFFNKSKKNRKLLISSLMLGVVALFLTFSYVSLFVFILGLGFILLLTKFGNRGFILSVVILLLLICSYILLSLLPSEILDTHPSLYRRANLNSFALHVVTTNNLWFGTGPNTSTTVLSRLPQFLDDLKYPQPVHNIFLLLLLESGVFATLFLLVFLGLLLFKLFKRVFVFKSNQTIVLGISIMQLIILGLFDHYLLTIHQTQLLFWFVVGLACSNRHKFI